MNIVQITPGAGGMYCGGCFRDNALVGALRKLGHSTLMVPLYLPLTLDESDQSSGTPIFFGGINVYLEQKLAWYRKAPRWLHRIFDSPALLKLASGSAAKTRPQDVGDLMISMIKGEQGNQARELENLIQWLKTQPKTDVVCLSNAFLMGFTRQIKKELRVPVVCLLSGEDSYTDALPDPYRERSWTAMAERAAEVDLFIAPSRYFADRMQERLDIPKSRMAVLPNGINLEGYTPASAYPEPPVLGYFARMCRDKGLHTLAETFVVLKKRDRIKNLKLRVGGGMGPTDEPLVKSIQKRFAELGIAQDAEFHPNLDREQKVEFFRSLSVLSVPALYGEAFGLYLVEALAAGVPLVQPPHGAFPEMIEQTGGGLISESTNAESLAQSIEQLLLNPERQRQLGQAGRKAVHEKYSVERMAQGIVELYDQVRQRQLVPVA